MGNFEANNKPESIPYYVHEEQVSRSEVHAKRWAIAALIAFIALLASNLCWFIYEMNYQDVVMSENLLEGSGVNILSNGDVAYGDKAEDNKD